MKICLPSKRKDLSTSLASSFGRCTYFVILDSDRQKTEATTLNEAKNAIRYAGIQAAQSLAKQQVKAVIASKIGPNAWDVLQESGIKIYTGIRGTLQKNVEAFRKGELQEMKTPMGPGSGMHHVTIWGKSYGFGHKLREF